MKAFSDLLTSFVTNNPNRRVYTTWEIDQNKEETFALDYARIPVGLLSLLVKQSNVISGTILGYRTYDFTFTPTAKTDYYHKTVMQTYALMLTQSANHLLLDNRQIEARKYLDLALSAVPNYPQALDLKKKFRL